MLRKYLCILAVLCLVLSVSGCKKEAPEQEEQSYPTLPEFREDLTPVQQLTAAIEKTRQQGKYDVRYGTKRTCDGQTEENSLLQAVTVQKPMNLDALYEYLPTLPRKDGFVQEFCELKLRVVPSNTGTLRFQMSQLAWEDAWQIMYDQKPEMEEDPSECEIAFEVDGAGRLSEFELIMTMGEETLTVFVAVTFTEDV